MANTQLGVRFPPEILAAIDDLVESGDFGNRCEFVQFAVRKMLMSYDGRGRTDTPPPHKIAISFPAISEGVVRLLLQLCDGERRHEIERKGAPYGKS